MSVRICIFLILSVSSLPLFGFQPMDSLRLNCQKKFITSLTFEDLHWLFRERTSNEIQGTTPIHLEFFIQDALGGIQSKRFSLGGPLEGKENLLAFSNMSDTPLLVWGNILSVEIQNFGVLKDSLLKVFKPRGFRVELLQAERGLAKQLDLMNQGRSKSALSLHNFNLAVDVGIYRRGRYLRRGNIYAKLGYWAKSLGAFWGGDFIGFPDVGHIQAFTNGAELVRKFPELTFEYIRFKQIYEQNYWNALAQGQGNLVEDTRQLMVELNKNRVQKVCACSQAILIPKGLSQEWFDQFKDMSTGYVFVQKQAGWVYIKSGNTGYFYSLGSNVFD
jgi:hypothetical protein